MERSLVLLKPDAVQLGLIGELITRIERRRLKAVAIKMIRVDEELARRHYALHTGKPFFAGLIKFITSSPLVAMVLEGENVILVVRSIMGATNPVDAAPGTVRGDLAVSVGYNLMHGSDSPEEAEREISLFFTPQEVLEYTRDIDRWIIES